MKWNKIEIGLTFIFLFIGNSLFSQVKDLYQEKLEKIDSILIDKIDLKEPGLSISITKDNQVIFEKYYGYADLGKNEKLNSQHVLGIASMSKQFTGMAVLFLVEEGKLNLDADIKDYMPDLPIGDRKIAIKQLLSHTSGLPEITKNETFMKNIAQKHTIQEIIDMAFVGDFTDNPGVKWQYCNTGYIIIAALIEKLSEQSLADYLHRMLFEPLHMSNTFSCDYNQDATNMVPRYFLDSTGYVNATTMHFSNLIGGGGIVSNVTDLAKWGMALTSGYSLPANYQEIWESNSLNSGESTGYGLGLAENSYKGKSYYYHPGMGDGMNSVNFIFPEDGITISVIRNISKPKINSIDVANIVTEYLFFK